MSGGVGAERLSIVVDWGTSSLRAALVDASGAVKAEREAARGIQFVSDGRFEATLMDTIGDWLHEQGPIPVFALGMVTSRNGWVEVAYADCPADAETLRAGAVTRELPNGSPLVLLPGLRDPSALPFPDVMRGEETQIVGFGLDHDRTVVLPGTHSKWARVEGGRIAGFRTFVTGEVFALLSEHSFVARTAAAPAAAANWPAFDRGAAEAAASHPAAGAFLSALFGARTGLLSGQLAPDDIRDYVSGLVIGHEFREARDGGLFRPGDGIGLVGTDSLTARYARVAERFGLAVAFGPADAAIRGALAIASRGGPARG